MADYVYSKDDVTNSTDIWDDTELIKMYEDSVSATYKKLGEPSSNSNLWSVGERCMARYYEDGLFYPAEIIDVDDETGQFLVLFGGYENSEWVSPEELSRETSSDAHLCNNVSMESTDTDSIKKQRSAGKGIKRDDSRKRVNSSRSSELSNRSATARVPHLTGSAAVQFRSPIIPSIAPPPPPALSGLTPPDEMEALSSMLMSWYMSGYHTGYYQALSDQKKAEK